MTNDNDINPKTMVEHFFPDTDRAPNDDTNARILDTVGKQTTISSEIMRSDPHTGQTEHTVFDCFPVVFLRQTVDSIYTSQYKRKRLNL